MITASRASDKHRSRRLAHRLAAYSTAAAGAALSADVAAGAIVPYVPDGAPLTFFNPGGGGTPQDFSIDLNGDTQTDFNLQAYLGFALFDPTALNYFMVDSAITHFATVVSPGETIGPMPDPPSDQWSRFGWFDNFIGKRGYIGLVFDIPGGSPHYGYLDIAVDSNNDFLTLYGGGYESLVDTPLTAPAPEPGSLALLAIGAAGLAAWRARGGREKAKNCE